MVITLGPKPDHLFLLLAEVPGHLLVDVLEHGPRVVVRRLALDAVLLRFGIGRPHEFLELGVERGVALLAPLAEPDQVLLETEYRIAQRPMQALVARPVAARIVAGRVRRHAIGVELDQRRPVVGAGAFGGPAGHGVDGEEIVAVDLYARQAEADRPRGKGRLLAAGDPLARRDRPL